MDENGRDQALQRMRQHLAATSKMFTLAYWIPHADGDVSRASPIQGFAEGLLRSSHLLMFASILPADIREMFGDRTDIIFSRSAGIVRPFVSPIMIEALPGVIAMSPYLLNCILSTEDMVEPVRNILDATGRHILHVGPPGSGASLEFNQLDNSRLASFMQTVVEAQQDTVLRRIFGEFLDAEPRPLPKMYTDTPEYKHNIALPNNAILHSLHVSHRSAEPIPQGRSEAYIDVAVRTADAVRLLRKALLPPRKFSAVSHGLILAVDSLTWPFLRGGIARLTRTAGLTKTESRFIKSVLARDGYFSRVATQNGEDLTAGMESRNVQAIVGLRSSEMRSFTAALALLGTSTMTPTLRLNPALNGLRASLTQISGCARGNGPHQNFKLRKLVNRLSASMERTIGEKMVSAIRRNSVGIAPLTVVSDLPLEWLNIQGIPLTVLHDVSRIPATPGNIMLSDCSRSERVSLGLSDFQEILVIRSFEAGDHIAGDLEAALNAQVWRDEDDMPTVRFVDVCSMDDFVEVVNSYSGAVLVFDGHGSTDKETGIGTIVVGGERVDVWQLRGRIHLPPIVILSACDTYPVDGSHGSSAVGMLALGATTVLGTLLPIHSKRAAVFIARLIYRIAKFVPIEARGRRLGVDWRYIMSGMLRMSHASEIISQFEKEFGLGFLEAIRTKTNMDINLRDEKWLTHMIRRLAALVNLPARRIWTWYEERLEFSDSLKYVQLGRPDLISIHEVSPREALGDLVKSMATITS